MSLKLRQTLNFQSSCPRFPVALSYWTIRPRNRILHCFSFRQGLACCAVLGWPRTSYVVHTSFKPTYRLPTSASRVLGLQAYTTRPSLRVHTKSLLCPGLCPLSTHAWQVVLYRRGTTCQQGPITSSHVTFLSYV